MVDYLADSLFGVFQGVYDFFYGIVFAITRVSGVQLSNSDKIFMATISCCVSLIILVYLFKFVWRLFRI